MQIRFGTFDEPLGLRATQGEWTFVACIGQLEGSSFASSHPLASHIDAATAPPVLRGALKWEYDAAWVRARLPRVFAYEPSQAAMEKTLLFETFAAVRGDDAYLFACTDYYGRTSLAFSEAGPEPSLRDAIANAFWELLLRAPDDLADFRARVFHPGTGSWLEFSCQGGEVALDETEE